MMKRGGKWWLFSGFAGISSLIFLATIGLWIRCQWKSYLVTYEIKYPGSQGLVLHVRGVLALRGHLAVGRIRSAVGLSGSDVSKWDLDASDAESIDGAFEQLDRLEPARRWFGFRWYSIGRDPTRTTYAWREQLKLDIVGVPYWAIALLTALLPAWWVWRVRLRKYGPGRCAKCGYDLRATPERCPECGAGVAKA